MCSHFAPAEERIVVSEMGETWSPNTAPPRVAETVMRVSVPLPPRIATAIGTRTPKVPQDVPVANASPSATAKKITGTIIDLIKLPLVARVVVHRL